MVDVQQLKFLMVCQDLVSNITFTTDIRIVYANLPIPDYNRVKYLKTVTKK